LFDDEETIGVNGVRKVKTGWVALVVSVGVVVVGTGAGSAVAAPAGTSVPKLCSLVAGIQKSAGGSGSHRGKGPDFSKMRALAQGYAKAARSATDPNVATALETMSAFFGKVAKAKTAKQANALLTNSPDLVTYSQAQSVFASYYRLNCPVPAGSSG
jgi:hypothetical protein